MTDQEVIELYRALLGRDPEDAGTIESFRRYYPSVARGRRAIFNSDEFERHFCAVTGRTPRGRDPAAGSLAHALLARAAGAVPVRETRPAFDVALRAGFQTIFSGWDHDRPRQNFAVAVGEPSGPALDDLAPLGSPHAAVLHVAATFPPVLPLAQTLDDGTSAFRLGADLGAVTRFVQALDRPVDALYLLGPPATPAWVDALRPSLAQHCLIVVGGDRDAFDAAAISASVASAHAGEPVQSWRGLYLHHLGGWLLPVTYEPHSARPEPLQRAAYPSLAVAAIVRNESACVQHMLRSARPVASFFAVLDTGSADDTYALARSALETSGVPFALAQRDHTAFDDDFAAMRNAALSLVPDEIDWVLMLDADEALAPEDAGPLLELIASGTHDAYALPRYNFPNADLHGTMLIYPDRQTRLFRNVRDGSIAYAGVVHETLRGARVGLPPLDASAIGGSRGGPHIHHLVRRFRTPEQEERKQAFYREIAARHAARAGS